MSADLAEIRRRDETAMTAERTGDWIDLMLVSVREAVKDRHELLGLLDAAHAELEKMREIAGDRIDLLGEQSRRHALEIGALSAAQAELERIRKAARRWKADAEDPTDREPWQHYVTQRECAKEVLGG